MDIERETVVQVVVSAFAIALFIAALVGLSVTFGDQQTINESVEGNISGEFQQLEQSQDSFEGRLDGHYSNGFEADLNGTVSNGTISNGTVSNGTASGQFEANVTGALKGTARGEINGTIENRTFEGTFNGTINGTDHDTTISPQGGLALVGLIAVFILLMPLFGYIIERESSSD